MSNNRTVEETIRLPLAPHVYLHYTRVYGEDSSSVFNLEYADGICITDTSLPPNEDGKILGTMLKGRMDLYPVWKVLLLSLQMADSADTAKSIMEAAYETLTRNRNERV